MNILVISHDLDMVMRKSFSLLSERPGFKVYIIGPGEASRPQEGKVIGIDSHPVTSKISPRAIKSIRRAIKGYDIDAVFSPSTSGLSNALAASIATKARNVGYRGTQHRIHRSDPFNYLALLNPRVAHVVCETSDIREYLTEFIPSGKLSWHHKPFDLGWVEAALAAPQPAPHASSQLRCIYIGVSKGRPFKGLSFLLEAMRILQPTGATLTVIGEASDDDIKSAPTNVTFLGNRPDAISFLPSHQLFILPSTRDASPRVVREAQACSLPCIVTDIPGARDLIIPGTTGLLVEPASPQSIAEAVKAIAANPAKMEEMGRAGRRNIAGNFAVQPFIDYLSNLFTSLK